MEITGLVFNDSGKECVIPLDSTKVNDMLAKIIKEASNINTCNVTVHISGSVKDNESIKKLAEKIQDILKEKRCEV